VVNALRSFFLLVDGFRKASEGESGLESAREQSKLAAGHLDEARASLKQAFAIYVSDEGSPSLLDPTVVASLGFFVDHAFSIVGVLLQMMTRFAEVSRRQQKSETHWTVLPRRAMRATCDDLVRGGGLIISLAESAKTTPICDRLADVKVAAGENEALKAVLSMFDAEEGEQSEERFDIAAAEVEKSWRAQLAATLATTTSRVRTLQDVRIM
jgi:hypothetical protein